MFIEKEYALQCCYPELSLDKTEAYNTDQRIPSTLDMFCPCLLFDHALKAMA
jgi:hypothetical protein